MRSTMRGGNLTALGLALLFAVTGIGRSSAQVRDVRVRWVLYTELASRPAPFQARRIAVPPPLIVQVFPDRGRLPDAYLYTLCRAAAFELGPLVRDLLSERGFDALYDETAAALEETGGSAADLIRLARGTEELLHDNRKNDWLLQMKRSELKRDLGVVTTFRFTPEALKGVSSGTTGLAVPKAGMPLQWNADSVSKLARRLNADAILVLCVDDVFKHGAAPIMRGLKVRVHAVMLAAEDASVVWDATLEGNSETTENSRDFLEAGERWEMTELSQCLEGMCRLTPVLVTRMTEHVK